MAAPSGQPPHRATLGAYPPPNCIITVLHRRNGRTPAFEAAAEQSIAMVVRRVCSYCRLRQGFDDAGVLQQLPIGNSQNEAGPSPLGGVAWRGCRWGPRRAHTVSRDNTAPENWMPGLPDPPGIPRQRGGGGGTPAGQWGLSGQEGAGEATAIAQELDRLVHARSAAVMAAVQCTAAAAPARASAAGCLGSRACTARVAALRKPASAGGHAAGSCPAIIATAHCGWP